MTCQTQTHRHRPPALAIAGYAGSPPALNGLAQDGWLRRAAQAVWLAALAWQQRAFDRHALEMLDDRLLRDIGLTRTESEKLLQNWRRPGAGE